MLSPATFIGIATATAPVGQPAPASGRSPSVQPARVLSIPPVAAPIMQQASPKSAATVSPAQQAAPPRNLPRGSLLDLSV
jgi:hypothetical protein